MLGGRAGRERLTSELAGKIHAASDMQDILATAAQELGRALGVSRALIRLREPGEQPTSNDGDREA